MTDSASDHSCETRRAACDVSEDKDNALDEVYTNLDTAKFQSIACLKFYSNGETKNGKKNTKDEQCGLVSSDQEKSQQQISTLTPLEQVELSFSSGVQLFMMVNPEEKQKLLAKASIQFLSGVKQKALKKSKQLNSRTESNETSKTSNRLIDVNENSKHENDCNVRRTGVPSPRTGTDTDDDKMQVEIRNRQPVEQVTRKHADISNSQDNSAQTPPRCNETASQKKQLQEQRKSIEAQPCIVGPSWRRSDESISVTNCEYTEQMHRHKDKREENEELNHKRNKSADPLDKRSFCLSSGKTMRHHNNYSEEVHQKKRAKYSQEHFRNPDKSSQEHSRNSSSNEDMNPPNEMNKTNTQIKKRIMLHQHNMSDGKNMNGQSEQMEEEATSPAAHSHNDQPSTSVIDATTLATFTEYTENMHKNMMQTQKVISNLIKSLSNDAQVPNTNQSSQCPFDMGQSLQCQSNSDQSGNLKKPKDSCIVM